MKAPIIPQGGTGYDAVLRKVLADWFTRFETWLRPIAGAWSLSAAQTGVVNAGPGVEAVRVGSTASYVPVAGWPTTVISGATGARIILQRAGVNVATIQANNTALWIDSNAGITAFRRGAINVETESMRIDAAGRLMVNQTTWPGSVGRMGMTYTIGAEEGMSTNAVGTFATCSSHVFRINGTVVGSINHTSATTTTYATSSDRRLKAGIEDAGPAGALIDAIQVRSFAWDVGRKETVSHGFIAQELARVFPDAVALGTPGDDGDGPLDRHGMPWGVDPSKLVALAIKGLQEQAAQIRALEARLSKLEH